MFLPIIYLAKLVGRIENNDDFNHHLDILIKITIEESIVITAIVATDGNRPTVSAITPVRIAPKA